MKAIDSIYYGSFLIIFLSELKGMFYLSLPSRMISTSSCVVIFALMDGTSKGEEIIFFSIFCLIKDRIEFMMGLRIC